MNILYVTKEYVNPQCGGIDRITYVLACELRQRGHTCISAYLQDRQSHRKQDAVFASEILMSETISEQQLTNLLDSKRIDFIIVQGVDTLMNNELAFIHEILDKQHRIIPLFYVFHQMPGYELCEVDSRYLLGKIFSKDCVKYIKQLLIQIVCKVNKDYACRKLYSKYNIPYSNADKIVLLSKNYVNDFNALARGSDKTKYVSIPNMLTYLEEECRVSTTKKHTVLIVARMDEKAKRIKRALQIWRGISHEILERGWRLTIVGEGEDFDYYKKYVEKQNIQNVQFEGQQNPLPYYQNASIFMMTSAYEGWPMTLMEAMQNGCVPIVFDSFKAIYDIVDNGKNGVIVHNNDIDTYQRELVRLMRDDSYLNSLAYNALKDCQRFRKDRIVGQWLELFNSCKHN